MSAGERALLGPLDVGAEVIGYEVTAMEGASEAGVLRVRFRALPAPQGWASPATIAVVVARLPTSEGAPAPAASAGPYAVYYEARPADEADAERLARGVSRTLPRHLDLPIPVALRGYRGAQR